MGWIPVTLTLAPIVMLGLIGYLRIGTRTGWWFAASPLIVGGPFSIVASEIVEAAWEVAYERGRQEMYDEFMTTVHRWINKGGTLKVREEGGVSVEEEGK